MIEDSKIRKNFTISESEYTAFIQNLEKINRKIDKWVGFDPITFTAEEIFTEKRDEINGTLFTIKTYKIEIEGVIPHYEGWQFVSSLEYDRMNKCVFVHNLTENIKIPKYYKNKTFIGCDHCGHKRYRAKSFVIYNEKENRYMEVGSSCLKNFFKQDISKLIPFINSIEDFKEEYNGTGNHVYYVDTLIFLLSVKYVIDKYGWVSMAKFYEECERAEYEKRLPRFVSTKDSALDLGESRELLKVKNSQIKYTKKVINFFKNYDAENNEYLINLCQTIKHDFIKNNKLGIAASMFITYEKMIEKENNKKEQEKRKNVSKHVGEIGQRLKKIKAEVIFDLDKEGNYGTYTIYKFKDEEGNILTSFYSGYNFRSYKGDIVEISGTVSNHDEFNGENQTVIKRLSGKVIEEK